VNVSLRVSLTYIALEVMLGFVARADMLFPCSASCHALSFGGALAYYVLLLPGLKTVGLLVPYSSDELLWLSLLREGLSLIATAVVLYVVLSFLLRLLSTVRASRAA
jgi:hypothetical protein